MRLLEDVFSALEMHYEKRAWIMLYQMFLPQTRIS